MVCGDGRGPGADGEGESGDGLAGLTDARATAAHEDGRLVVTVTGADPGRVRDAVAGFALAIRIGPSPAPQTTAT